ncbi:MAG: HesA/MoeB/ThiF family protein [Magnetococcales bacterium]|nr:HesA/MoeB/ThiF family protein [Magnetococcales bacterium]
MTDAPTGVLLIGAGGLGCAAALALTMGGIPRLGLADPDGVSLSNLHRQILYRSADIGTAKVRCAARRLEELAPGLRVDLHPRRLDTVEAIAGIARGYAVTIDASDNFITRFAANDAAIREGFTLVHGAAIGFVGQLMTITPGACACLRCLFTAPPATDGPTCQNEGVLGPLVGEVGWLMAMEAIKVLRGVGHPLRNRMLTLDLLTGKRRAIQVPLNPRCLCASRRHS